MTDKELIQALRCCTCGPDCDKCAEECVFYKGNDVEGCVPDMGITVSNRMEALLAENEDLREVTKMMPKWVSVSERLPETTTETYNDIDGEYEYEKSVPVIGASRYGEVAIVWYIRSEDGEAQWEDEPGTEYDITHWQPLPEPPSTEGVE